MLPAEPDTVTISFNSGLTVSSRTPAGSFSTSTGFMYKPPGATTSTSNGVGGSGVHVKRPSLSVRASPARPRIVISAPATGSP
jgi:hypothetical protein